MPLSEKGLTGPEGRFVCEHARANRSRIQAGAHCGQEGDCFGEGSSIRLNTSIQSESNAPEAVGEGGWNLVGSLSAG